jgi:hypothetical protein
MQCVRCGAKIGLFKTGGRLEQGQRYYEIKQDPGSGEKSAELKEISRYSSAKAGRLCRLCWARWQAEQEEGRALMQAAKTRTAQLKAKESVREAALRDRAVALDRMPLSDAASLKQYADTMKNATRSQILDLGTDGESFGLRDYRKGELSVTFFANYEDRLREWTIVRTGPTTWVIAASRVARRN